MTTRRTALTAGTAAALILVAAILYSLRTSEPQEAVSPIPPEEVHAPAEVDETAADAAVVAEAIPEPGPTEAPVPAELRDRLVSFGGCLAEKHPEFVRLTALTDDGSKMVTPEDYAPPFRIKIRARTDSTNIRLKYSIGWVILNWEVDRYRLMVGDLSYPIELAFPGRGYITENEWHDIVWEVVETRTRLLVDGEERFSRDGDYASILSSVAIGPAWRSTVDVASLVVESLPRRVRMECGPDEMVEQAADETGAEERKPRALRLAWSSLEQNGTYCVAWADYDKDGDPDLAVGNKWGPANNQIYRNDDGNLLLAWTSPHEEKTESDGLAWADYDKDGDPDLAVGDEGNGCHIYANEKGDFRRTWSSPEKGSVMAVDWADFDGDKDPDLAVACTESSRNFLYRNDGGTLVLAWMSDETDRSEGQAWGDFDGDGDPDLAVANFAEQANRVYRNDGGKMVLAWTSDEVCNSLGLDWGDFDGDKDLDLAVANEGQPNCVYRNDGGKLALAWCSRERDRTRSVAWGDWDGDGDLDLAAGNEGDPNRVYENRGGKLVLAWSSYETDKTICVAWADVNGDRFLDLAAGNKGPNRIYLNVERKEAKPEVF